MPFCPAFAVAQLGFIKQALLNPPSRSKSKISLLERLAGVSRLCALDNTLAGHNNPCLKQGDCG
jgi:hypothetical protein